MSNGNSNHKSRPYHFPAPLLIKSDSPITITDGKASLVHEGNIIIRIVDGYLIELQPQDKTPEKQPQSIQKILIDEPDLVQSLIPADYTLLMTNKAKRATYGSEISEYQYYKREKDASYFVVIKQGDKIIRDYNLGSLLDPDSKITLALKTLNREKPFYRRDLKYHLMPSSLKQGQLIKSCLDILAHEGFLSVQNIPLGEHKLERYTRTPKMLP
jgi:hypothetical protein